MGVDTGAGVGAAEGAGVAVVESWVDGRVWDSGAGVEGGGNPAGLVGVAASTAGTVVVETGRGKGGGILYEA